MTPRQHTLNTSYLVGPVHCYSAVLNDELVLFDCGPPTTEAFDLLARELPLERLSHIVITHCHVEHYGLATRLQQETGAQMFIPYRDHLRLRHHREHIDGLIELLRQAGFEDRFLTRFHEEVTSPDMIYPTAPQDYLITETDLPDRLGLSVLSCPGHSQSDHVLYTRDWAITGDTILHQVFQAPLLEIDLLTGDRFNNYLAYCESLGKLASLRKKLILPGHRDTIDSVDSCLLFYLNKLLDRAARVLAYPIESSPFEIIRDLLGINYDVPYLSYAKASEIMFIRDFLKEPDILRQAVKEIGLFPFIDEKFASLMGTRERKAS